MANIPPINNLQAFEAVARRRSFALAAAELNLTPSAVSHQVAKLEAYLCVRLFERSAHGVTLSAAGTQYLSRIRGALAAITTASDDLRHGVTNSLYVHSAPSIASLWLMPRLRAFATANPDITLNLSAAHTPSNFELGQADIDIRYGIPNWGDLVVEPLFEESITPLASPQFIAEHDLHQPSQLLELPLIQSSVSLVQWSDWFKRFTDYPAPDNFAVRFDRAQMSLDAATQGLGVALESTTIAEQHLKDKSLVQVFAPSLAIKVKAHFAVYPPRYANRRPVKEFLAWIHNEASRRQ
jgi:DNA-binding transcriptional LysR family regulator